MNWNEDTKMNEVDTNNHDYDNDLGSDEEMNSDVPKGYTKIAGKLQAYQFYKDYAKCQGFVVRKYDIKHDKKESLNCDALVCLQQRRIQNRKTLGSSRSDSRSLAYDSNKMSSKVSCNLGYNTSKWKTPLEFVHLYLEYCSMNDGDKAQVDSLHLYSKGGHADLGFCKKDLYNHIDKQKHVRIEDGDAFAALFYLQAKAR
ncbi:hypothetical protein GmHk_18G051675 [Glycine max]|nr:hypothetical protein GmHk_18G051675 [Glycine max]